MKIQSLAVFCGSQKGADPAFETETIALGKLLAANNIQLIYGGGSVGLMGVIADTMMKNDGRVIGVIPSLLIDRERNHTGVTEMIVVDDMHTRKRIMYEKCDAALVLPGGMGTLDEMFELITWNQLSIHDKHIFVMNTSGYYDHLMAHIYKMQQEKFLYNGSANDITLLENANQLTPFLQGQ